MRGKHSGVKKSVRTEKPSDEPGRAEGQSPPLGGLRKKTASRGRKEERVYHLVGAGRTRSNQPAEPQMGVLMHG